MDVCMYVSVRIYEVRMQQEVIIKHKAKPNKQKQNEVTYTATCVCVCVSQRPKKCRVKCVE